MFQDAIDPRVKVFVYCCRSHEINLVFFVPKYAENIVSIYIMAKLNNQNAKYRCLVHVDVTRRKGCALLIVHCNCSMHAVLSNLFFLSFPPTKVNYDYIHTYIILLYDYSYIKF